MLRSRCIVLVVVFLLLTMIFSGNLISTLEADGNKIKVAVTQPIIGKIFEEAFGEHVDVLNLIPPGTDPHHYEPPLGEILEAIENCEAIFTSGPHHLAIEDKIMDLASEGYINIPIFTLYDYMDHGLEILKIDGKENYHGALMSYSGARALIETFLDFVSSKHPELYIEMKKSADNYLLTLKSITEKASERFSGLNVALYSPVLQYALHDANVSVGIILTEDPETPSTMNDLQTLYEKYYTKKIDIVILTDIDLRVDNKIEEYLQKNNIKYLKIDVLGKSPVDIYGELAYSEAVEFGSGFQYGDNASWRYYLYISLTLNIMLIILVVALVNKIRKS